MRISDWSSDVCSSDLTIGDGERKRIMGRSIWVFAVALGVTLGACRAMVPPVPPSAADAPPPDATGPWRATATDADKQRIRGWHSSWQAALSDDLAKGIGAVLQDRQGVRAGRVVYARVVFVGC